MECTCFSSSPVLKRVSSLSRPSYSASHPPAHCSLSFLSSRFSFKGIHIAHPHPLLTGHFSLPTPPVTTVYASIPAQSSSLKPDAPEVDVPPRSVSVILLAGGTGKRMGANMPKQYLPLLGQPIALHSFYTFAAMDEVKEIVVVCDPSYRDVFEEAGKDQLSVELKFALPGRERQFSVLNGLQEICESAKLACVHDSARPLVLARDIRKVLSDAYIHGAAVLGVPVKGTIKQAKKDGFVLQTLDRSLLWEMQTPQVIEPSLLRRGFELVEQKSLEVTDDVSIVEHLKHPVFITEGSYTNIKVPPPPELVDWFSVVSFLFYPPTSPADLLSFPGLSPLSWKQGMAFLVQSHSLSTFSDYILAVASSQIVQLLLLILGCLHHSLWCALLEGGLQHGHPLLRVTTPDDMIVAERILQQGAKAKLESSVAGSL